MTALSRFFKFALLACCVGDYNGRALFGRSHSGESCLFELQHLWHRAHIPIPFSLLRPGGVMTLRRASHALSQAGLKPPLLPEAAIEEFFVNRLERSKAKIQAQLSDGWPVFETLRRWQIDSEDGLSHTFADRQSSVTLDYSDIFEARRNPDKGGHGPGLFFRYTPGK